MKVFYFGCHREAGHYFWVPGMQYAWGVVRLIPWRSVDPTLCPGADPDPNVYRRTRPEVEGEALLHHKDGWTALSFWDRSVDERGGCNSQFFAEGTHTFEEMLALAREHFPEVMKRFAFEIRLAPELSALTK